MDMLPRRVLLLLAAGALLLLVVPALAFPGSPVVPAAGNELAGALPAAPATCAAVRLSAARPGRAVCVAGLRVQRVRDTQTADGHGDFRRDSTAVLTDGHVRRTAHLADLWWQNGAMTAGLTVTVWAQVDRAGVLQVQRWTERGHRGRLTPLAQISRGLVPENTYVWTVGVVYAPLTQELQGDGDTHLQMLSPCGAAGITAETTPALRGYVDRPLPRTVPAAGPVRGTQDDPPPDVPIAVYGATRFDYGHGWWEVHPVRAWHVATSAELAATAADCAAEGTRFDRATGLPYGAPACGGDVPGETPCGPRCYVTTSEVGRKPVVHGRCDEDLQPHGPTSAPRL